jgi:putative Ca2+/H+ antiporter (TMEM165/GDT1 family)
MEAFLTSTGLVTLAELGDKTQLLAFVLAARFHRPLAILGGIAVATALNHALAGIAGAWLVQVVAPELLWALVALSFLGMALWSLCPDRLEQSIATPAALGVFAASALAFFVAEMGDKTQVATVVLVARYATLWSVVAGTTLGMLLANLPAVLCARRLAERLPLRVLRPATAIAFAALGLLAWLGRSTVAMDGLE